MPASQLEDLLKDPNGPLWKEKALESQLEEYPGSSFDIFARSVAELESITIDFKTRLDLDEAGRVCWTEKTGLKLAMKRASLSMQK